MRWLEATIKTMQKTEILLANHIQSMLTQSLGVRIF